jgi:hypothetical protein
MKFNAKTQRRKDTARRSRNQTLPLLHAMEERAGERRRVCGMKLECPSPRSSPHSVAGRGRKNMRNGKSSRNVTILTDSTAKGFEKLASWGFCTAIPHFPRTLRRIGRSAPVPGRSNILSPKCAGLFTKLPPAACCCSRGRLHSVSVASSGLCAFAFIFL